METPTPTPETTPQQRAERALSLDSVMRLREQQKSSYDTHFSAEAGFDDEAAMQSDMESAIRDYLMAEGVDETHPQYGDLYSSLRDLSFDNIGDSTWRFGEWKVPSNHRAGLKSGTTGLDRLHAHQEVLFGERLPDTIDDSPEIDDTTPSPEQAEIRERINGLSKAKQEAYVKLIGMPFYRMLERKAAKAAYAKALEDYTTAVREISHSQIKSHIEEGDDNKTAFQKLADMFNQSMQTDANAEQALFLAKGGKRGKALEWYARQSMWKKIGIGAATGVGLAATGFAAGAVGLGVGALGVVGGGLAAGRVSKTYLASLSRLYRDSPDKIGKMSFDNPDALTLEQAAQLISDYVTRESNERVKSAEKTRKIAIGWAVGSLATGAALATAGALAQTGDWQGVKVWRNPTDTQWSTRGLINRDSVIDTPGESGGSGEGAAGGGGGDPGADEREHYYRMNEAAQEAAERAEAHENAITSHIDAHEAGTDVTKGEGWYQTFKDFGVPGQYRDDLLKEIGPQLEKMGDAYKTSDGLWGISQPGELSDEASRLIVERAGEHGWIDLSLTSPVAEVVDNVPDALEQVKPGEGILQSLNDAGVENPTLEDVAAVQDQLVQDGAAYANGPDGYAGLNLPENGTMNAAGVETLQDYADNKQLDSSGVVNVESHTVGTGESAVDYNTLTGVEEFNELADPSDAKMDHLHYLEATEMNNDIHEMSELLKSQNLEAINTNPDYQDALQYVQQDLKGVMYPGTDIPVMETKYTVGGGEQWVFNPIPKESYMPAKAINTLVAYEQSKFALAA